MCRQSGYNQISSSARAVGIFVCLSARFIVFPVLQTEDSGTIKRLVLTASILIAPFVFIARQHTDARY